MNEKFEKEVLERFDLIVKLLSQMNLDPEAPQTESIFRLNKIGLRSKQIAEILNTTRNYVNMVLSRRKRKTEGGKNAKEK